MEHTEGRKAIADEDLKNVNGGIYGGLGFNCPKCQSANVERDPAISGTILLCKDCGFEERVYVPIEPLPPIEFE
jgi:hypothetical protein